MGTRISPQAGEVDRGDERQRSARRRGPAAIDAATESRDAAGWTRFPDRWRSDVAWGL